MLLAAQIQPHSVCVWDLSVYPKHYLVSSLLGLKHLTDSLFCILPRHFFLLWRRTVFGFLCTLQRSLKEVLQVQRKHWGNWGQKVKSRSPPAWHSSAETHPQPPFLPVPKESCLVCFCAHETTTEAKDFSIFRGTRTQATPFSLQFYSYPLVSPPRILKSLSVCLSSPGWLSGEFVRSLPYPSPWSFLEPVPTSSYILWH